MNDTEQNEQNKEGKYLYLSEDWGIVICFHETVSNRLKVSKFFTKEGKLRMIKK